MTWRLATAISELSRDYGELYGMLEGLTLRAAIDGATRTRVQEEGRDGN